MNKYIEMMKAQGWRVFMRDGINTRKPAEYCFVTDGTRIAYVQWSNLGDRVSTVHKANLTTGTGFSMGEPAKITPEVIEAAMNCHAPNWATQSEAESVRKYKDWDEYHNESKFNAELYEV